jgi:hypothetical protein
MSYAVELYEPSPRTYRGVDEPEYPFHDRTGHRRPLRPYLRRRTQNHLSQVSPGKTSASRR